jgi:ABC-2 type transport system permease protein
LVRAGVAAALDIAPDIDLQANLEGRHVALHGGGAVMRYLRLYLKFIEFSFGRAMEFRMDFYFRIFMDLIFYIVSFSFFKILFLHSSQVGGWNEPQVMIFVGCFIIVDAIQMTMFANNTWNLPFLINKGDLDYYLVRPVSSFFMANFRDFAANSFINLVMAGSFLTWALVVYPEPLGFGRIFLFLVMTFVGAMLFQFVRILFILPVFWTHSGRGLDTLFWSVEKFMERPHGIYKGFIKVFLLTVLPMIAMTSMPTSVLFESNPWPNVGICLLVTTAYLFISTWLWRVALANYSSASS